MRPFDLPLRWQTRRLTSALAVAVALAVPLAGCTTGAGTTTGAAAPQTESVQIEVVTTAPPAGSSASVADAVGEAATTPDTPTAVHTVVAHAVAPSVVARSGPDGGAPVVAELANPIASGTGLVFQAVDGGAENAEWIEVLLPVEPNGTTGWVRRSEVDLTTNPYRIEIDRASFSLEVYNLDELWIETTIAVGTGETPTPVGDFYLLELLAPPDPDGAYGPYAFGLSGFSEVLDGFGGADEAIIGLHGTDDPSSLGSTVSFGCIRLENAVISQLAQVLPLGTPVSIT